MTWRDKLEIGLKPDAPHRKDNLPAQEVHGPEVDAGEGRSPVIPEGAGSGNRTPQSNSESGTSGDEGQKGSTADDRYDLLVTMDPGAERQKAEEEAAAEAESESGRDRRTKRTS